MTSNNNKLAIFMVIFLVNWIKVEAVLVGSQFLFVDSTNPGCSGEALLEFPLMPVNTCFDSDTGPDGNSIRFDCEENSMTSYIGKGCREDSIAGVQKGCTSVGNGESVSYGCLDFPIEDLIVVETGRFCDDNTVKNRTQVSVFQLNKCFATQTSSFQGFQIGEQFRMESYNNTECIANAATTITNVFVNDKCVEELGSDGKPKLAFFTQRASVSPILGNNSATKLGSLLFVSIGVVLASLALSVF